MSAISTPPETVNAATPAIVQEQSVSSAPSITPFASLRRHRGLAAITFLLVVLAGLPIAWFKGAPRYSATAVIFVSPRFLANLEDAKEFTLQSNSEYREYVQQNVRTINRFDILLEALKRVGPLNSIWVEPGESLERAAERLQGELGVETVPDTYQITITLQTVNKKTGLAELVNSIAAVYLEKAKEEQFYSSDQRIQNLVQDRERLQQEMEGKRARRLAIAQDLGVSTFTENYINPYDRLLVTVKEAQSDARTKKIQAEAHVSAITDKDRKGGTDSLRAYALDQVARDPSILSLTANLNLRRTQVLASISGLSPTHPGRIAGERELAEIEKERQDTYQKLLDSYSKMLLDQRSAEAYATARTESKLTDEVTRQSSQASWFTSNYQEALQLGLDAEQARKRLDSIQQRIDFLSLEKNAPGFVRLFSAARVPLTPAKGGRRKFFAVFCALGFLLAFITPIGVDMADPRLHSIMDVERLLGFPVFAWLMEKKEAGPEFAREQILRLATRISQEQQTNNSTIFAFTSVKAQGGTSTLVIETARALTVLGVSSLAVEANAYRADPRYRKPGSRGLTVVLNGHQSIDSAVVAGDDELPERVPVGDLQNEKNLPDIQNLIEVLRQAAASYSVILVDLPPILVSVDAELIARAADVAVLVIEAESVTKEELRRAAKSLERLHVPAVSAVLNRVRGNAAAGLANSALLEFTTGSAPPPSKWFSPWLWK